MEDIEIDKDQALEWMFKGAYFEDANCLNCLGQRYMEGEGVTENYEKAKELFRLASDKGSKLAVAMSLKLEMKKKEL